MPTGARFFSTTRKLGRGGGGSISLKDHNKVKACCTLLTSPREIVLSAGNLDTGRQPTLQAEQGGVGKSRWWDKHKCSSHLKE